MNKKSLEKLDPGSFGFVMATGIVSIAFLVEGWLALSMLFLFIGTVSYLWLVFIFSAKFYVLGKRVIQEVTDIQKMFKYLTFSAGSNVLAARFSLAGNDTVSMILGFMGILSTIVLLYAIFYILFFQARASIQLVSPFWLLLSIACNSSGIELTLLWEHELIAHPIFLLAAFSFWTFGITIYFVFMTLNIYRMLFLPFEGKDLNPAYWTCMGAAAIAVVDGSRLTLVAGAPQFLMHLFPFIRGVVLLLWCWGTAWIPILILMGVCKHLYFKLPFYYQPSLWAVVFPLGMYATSIAGLLESLQLDVVQGMIPIWLWIAAATWLFIFYLGMKKNDTTPYEFGLRLFKS